MSEQPQQPIDYASAHYFSDTDQTPESIHHTIGSGPSNYVAGNHTHRAEKYRDNLKRLELPAQGPYIPNFNSGITATNHQVWKSYADTSLLVTFAMSAWNSSTPMAVDFGLMLYSSGIYKLGRYFWNLSSTHEAFTFTRKLTPAMTPEMGGSASVGFVFNGVNAQIYVNPVGVTGFMHDSNDTCCIRIKEVD